MVKLVSRLRSTPDATKAGSRWHGQEVSLSLSIHTKALRFALGAALLLTLAGFTAVLAVHQADAGAVGTVFVNSTSNTDDGQCNGPPNDLAVGNCTFREAINDVNDGLADTIKFHPAVFSKRTPGIIQLDLSDGQLPSIEREVVIDNTGTGVILDCDAENDGTWGDCGEEAIAVILTHNAFDFTLIGAKNFVIREVAGDAIVIESDDGPFFSLGDVEISGVTIDVNNVETGTQGDAGIDIDDIVGVNHLVITNSDIQGEDSGSEQAGVRLYTNGEDLHNNNVEITNNRIYGALGVDVQFFGDLYTPNGLNGAGHTINVDVYENESIVGNLGHAVAIGYCAGDIDPDGGAVGPGISGEPPAEDGDTCDARLSTINFEVTENGKISSNDGDGDGVRLDVLATQTAPCIVPCNDRVTVNLNVDDNAIIDSDDDDGVDIETQICCATSDSTANISVSGNLDIVGDDDGVEVNAEIGEGPDNTVNINVDGNGEITGEGDNGVDIDALAGSDMPAAEIIDADENELNISVSGNEDIAGDNDDGIQIDAVSGKEEGAGDADRNITNVVADNNGNVDGDDEGIDIDARAGTREGPGDADDNLVTVSTSGNGTVDGADDDGIEIDAIAGHTEEQPPIINVTGDGNSTEVVVDGNAAVKGHDGDGVDLNSRAGGLQPTGEENHTAVDVTNNGVLQGFQFEGDGVQIDSKVCCDPDNENGGQTNFINISNNDDIIGTDGDGIDIDQLCCSVNTVLIQDNTGVIKGNEDNGIEVSPCLTSGDPTDSGFPSFNFGADADDDLACLGDSVTMLVITGNNISDSGNDGIIVCCGSFQFPVNQAPTGIAGAGLKSLIQDNVISHNGEDGIDLDTTIGINVIENEIFQNGTSVLDGDNGVEIDWQFGWLIAEVGTCGIVAPGGGPAGSIQQQLLPFCIKVPAHFNRISENSIYDNVGLGINLIGMSLDPFIQAPGSGTEDPGWLITDGVGCIQLDVTPIGPNDCIPYPKILFTGGPTIAKVSGSACGNCHVEVFIADPTPADQTGPLGRQFGEGRTYLVTTTADDLGAFSVNLPCGLAAGDLTATATDKLKNTSEFASNIPFPGTPACAAATEQPADTPAPTSTPAPTATAVPPTATAEPAGLCGDVNSDGVTNSIDASLILQLGAGMFESLPKGNASGDVNGDGNTNSVDAALILQNAASMIAGLSC